jgi:hypothetical protein
VETGKVLTTEGGSMKRPFKSITCATRALCLTMLASGLTSVVHRAAAQAADSSAPWQAVEQTLGRRPAMSPGGIRRFGFARGDLRVTVGDVQLLPALALGSWVAFRPEGTLATLMGDLVLTEDELTPVQDRLIHGGIAITAVHNHLLHEAPRVMYVHIHGHGAPQRLAEAIHAALALTKTPLGTPPAVMPVRIDLDTAAIATALGFHGSVNGGVYQVGVPRAGVIRDGGLPVAPAMGVATAINFQPLGSGRAATTGDFVMTASEVQPVVRALRAAGLTITALHGHMTDEQPRLFFMHFWGEGDAVALARGLRTALDRMAIKRS